MGVSWMTKEIGDKVMEMVVKARKHKGSTTSRVCLVNSRLDLCGGVSGENCNQSELPFSLMSSGLVGSKSSVRAFGKISCRIKILKYKLCLKFDFSTKGH
ncbi:unnamed protein product [Allacma fusca]|uniref:Uncharacterized protein n=1 Tax=Allacma fusca TaxID=39272 RepID=A0A8J2PC55_9HEXA|nr:unnamed protein product [Allacma fusca]